MPNWCENVLTIKTKDEKVLKQILETIKGQQDNDGEIIELVIDFQKIIPRPKSEENNWFDWNCANWGTKWNADSGFLNKNTISFFTAWTPPEPIVKKLSEMFPNVSFSMKFTEPGDRFYGRYEYKNGIAIKRIEKDYK